jgi:hypothetical protein
MNDRFAPEPAIPEMSDFVLNGASRESYRFDSDEHAGDVRAETDHCPRRLLFREKLSTECVLSRTLYRDSDCGF